MPQIRSMEDYWLAYASSIEDPSGYWAEEARALTWFHPFDTVMDVDLEEVDFSWFGGGRLNACYNCVDRHLATMGDKTAIIWVGNEPGTEERISFRALKPRNQFKRV